MNRRTAIKGAAAAAGVVVTAATAHKIILDKVFAEVTAGKKPGVINQLLLRFDISFLPPGAGANPTLNVTAPGGLPIVLPYSRMILRRAKSTFTWVQTGYTGTPSHYVVFTCSAPVVTIINGLVTPTANAGVSNDQLTFQIARDVPCNETQDTVPYLLDRSGFTYAVVPYLPISGGIPVTLAYNACTMSHRMELLFDVIEL